MRDEIMGLDNGFIVKSTKRQITSEDLPEGVITPFSDSYNPNGEDIVYWRKNYGLRNAVRKVLGMSKDEFTYEIDTPKQIMDIVQTIFYFKDKIVWKDEGDSIWDYVEIEPILQRDIINLVLMIPFMKENPDVYIEFYDSF